MTVVETGRTFALSERGRQMPASPIRKLAPLAEAAKKRGLTVYHLNIGQPDIETPGCMRDRLKVFDEKVLEYSPSTGSPQYLRSLQRYVPSLAAGDLIPGPSGVRAQALAPDGTLVDDFVFDVQGSQVIHVRNAPSPAATSSLGIARLIADKAEEVFSLR